VAGGSGLDLAERVLAPLWRGLAGYRVLAFGYACALAVAGWTEYRRPFLAGAVLVVVGLWTGLSTYGYLRVRCRRRWLVTSDLVITVATVAATVLVQTPARIATGAPVLTSVWSAGSPIAVALSFGLVPGVVAALIVQGAVLAVRGGMGTPELTDLLLLVAATSAVGYAGTVLRRSAAELRTAIELRAALAERERLARTIHDGVLQVLAQVHRRGRAVGGPAGELGELAGEQEVALRTLIASGPPEAQPAGRADLSTALAGLATTRVSVSGPGTPVALPAHVVAEVVAASREALANVTEHVGPEAPAWVLLEDVGHRVLVSIRDDGPGIPEGRLAEAEAAGRLGVARSIRGRIEAVGGTAVCDSGPGQGTEWTFSLGVAR
jgi:signal transduction histidine kinase